MQVRSRQTKTGGIYRSTRNRLCTSTGEKENKSGAKKENNFCSRDYSWDLNLTSASDTKRILCCVLFCFHGN